MLYGNLPYFHFVSYGKKKYSKLPYEKIILYGTLPYEILLLYDNLPYDINCYRITIYKYVCKRYE